MTALPAARFPPDGQAHPGTQPGLRFCGRERPILGAVVPHFQGSGVPGQLFREWLPARGTAVSGVQRYGGVSMRLTPRSTTSRREGSRIRQGRNPAVWFTGPAGEKRRRTVNRGEKYWNRAQVGAAAGTTWCGGIRTVEDAGTHTRPGSRYRALLTGLLAWEFAVPAKLGRVISSSATVLPAAGISTSWCYSRGSSAGGSARRSKRRRGCRTCSRCSPGPS